MRFRGAVRHCLWLILIAAAAPLSAPLGAPPAFPQGAIGDADVIRELAAVSDITQPHAITHYLYVSTSDLASELAQKLRDRGFTTEERRSGYANDWLVLAHHEVVPTLKVIASARREMETLAAMFGGEYDGWEAAVRR